MSALSEKLSYANVIATLALFLALTGGAYAVTNLPTNSVGPKQLRKSAVTNAKVKKGSLAADRFSTKARAALRGAPGPKGDQGAAGAAGTSGSLAETLPSGKTLKGAWSAGGEDPVTYATTAISFPIPLATNPARQVIGLGDPPTANCPGTAANPLAAPGQLCVYEGDGSDTVGDPSVCGADKCGAGDSNRLGASIVVSGDGSGIFYSQGTYAVTAP